jgi:uncharacterized protein Usg
VLHDDLQYLYYDLVDMHKLSPQINEVMEFRRRVNVKQILEKISSLETVLYTFVWTLKQIVLDINIFCRFVHLWNKSSGTIHNFGARSNSTKINSQILLTGPIGLRYTKLENFEFES